MPRSAGLESAITSITCQSHDETKLNHPLKRIVPGSYIPFGVGPRHCFAMRFSLAEAKLALARIVMRFKLEPAPGTSYPTEMGANIGLICPEKPLVRLVKRS